MPAERRAPTTSSLPGPSWLVAESAGVAIFLCWLLVGQSSVKWMIWLARDWRCLEERGWLVKEKNTGNEAVQLCRRAAAKEIVTDGGGDSK